MLILAVLLALALGWCTGGRLIRYVETPLYLLPLPILALLMQRALGLLPAEHYLPWAAVLLLMSYAMIFLFLWRNRRFKRTAALAGLGSLCNLAVIAANGWRMPVSAAAAGLLSPDGLAQLAAGAVPMYALEDSGNWLRFLGDVIYCPVPLIGGFASIGDVLLAAGVFFLLLAIMKPIKLPRWMVLG
ncbi:DUF5317 domain-containing protein [uncultured Pseudoflavonifractor sp.]|uniref:DUF5317 domain-containing protein n=1 Tax=uncultured Pseudoflavonifractor sp. TaxID=1221379 RepID=UPI0025D80A48|nr:DUF5317 domain-containing protein [uncultured Pseudoflavonifractor sp.]